MNDESIRLVVFKVESIANTRIHGFTIPFRNDPAILFSDPDREAYHTDRRLGLDAPVLFPVWSRPK